MWCVEHRMHHVWAVPRVHLVPDPWQQGAPGNDGEDPRALPSIVSASPLLAEKFDTLFIFQDDPAHKDKILQHWQVGVGWAQLCWEVCQGELQAAEEVPAGRRRGSRAAVWPYSVYADIWPCWEDRARHCSEVRSLQTLWANFYTYLSLFQTSILWQSVLSTSPGSAKITQLWTIFYTLQSNSNGGCEVWTSSDNFLLTEIAQSVQRCSEPVFQETQWQKRKFFHEEPLIK